MATCHLKRRSLNLSSLIFAQAKERQKGGDLPPIAGVVEPPDYGGSDMSTLPPATGGQGMMAAELSPGDAARAEKARLEGELARVKAKLDAVQVDRQVQQRQHSPQKAQAVPARILSVVVTVLAVCFRRLSTSVCAEMRKRN